MTTGCSVATPTLVYVWPTKEEFDKLGVEEMLHDWRPDRTGTMLRSDGLQWQRRCHSKTIEGSGITVIFQWFDERPVALCATADVTNLASAREEK